MAKVFCRFCGHEWHENLLNLTICPDCEYADTPDMFQILEWEDGEILELWKRLQECFTTIKPELPKGLTTLYVPKTEDRPWEKLILQVLIYDNVLICEQWKLLFVLPNNDLKKYIPLVMKLFDAGIVYFIDDPETLFPARVITDTVGKPYQEDFTRIINSKHFLELFKILNKYSEQSPILNYWLLEKFAHYQTGFQLLSDNNASKRLYAAYSKAYPGGRGPDFYKIMTQGNRFQTLAVLLDTQLSLHHDWISPVLKAYCGLETSQADLVNEVLFDNKFLFIPKSKNINSLLDIRNSNELVQLRRDLSQVANMTNKELMDNLENIKRMVNNTIEVLNKKLSKQSDIIALSTAGFLATAGSLLGGLPGAILGGIGGAVVGKLSGDVSRNIFYKVNKNWAILISRFIGK